MDEVIDFEKALAELENIVRQLESGDLPLAQSLEQYEKGVDRLRLCYQALDEAEARVRSLSVNESGELVEKPFVHPKDPTSGD